MNESDIDLHKDSIDPSINGESILDSIPVIHSDESSRENEYDEFVLHSDEEFKLERSEILESLMYKTDDIELIGSESIYTTANNAKTTNNHACVNEQSIQTDQSYADFNQIPKELVNSIRDLVKAELRAESNTIIIHHGIECFYCKTDPIVGVLYCCPDCNFNICEECEDNLDHEHPLYKIKSAAGSRKRSESFSVTELIKKPIIQLQQEFKNQQPIQIQSDVSGAIYKRPTGKEIQKQLNQLFELGFSDKVQCITAIVKSNYDIDRHPDSDFLRYLFEEIEKGSEILHVFNQFEPPITLESIPRILKELTIHFTYDFAAAVSCFKTKSNKNDLYDVLNHSNISFESFKKRLGNFLLEKLYQTEGYEGGIAQLIEDTRYRQEHESEEYQYQDQHQEQLQDPSHMSILENQLTPKTRKSTWISDKLDASLSEISMIFNNNVNNISGLIDIRICREIIKEIFEILKLNFSKNELLKLNIFIDKKYPPKKIDDTLLFEIKPEAIEELKKLGIDPTVVFPKINLEELIGLIESWSETVSEPKQDDNIVKLSKTIKEYSDILNIMQINNQNVSNVENLVENLKKQLKDYIVNKEKDIEKQRFNVQRENLREVFVFYGQVKLPGKSSTFEEIKENQSVLTIQKFLQFCMDFNIIGIPTQQCRFISQDEVKIMFKRVSMSSRIMKESHFFDALDKISDLFYNKKYDEIYGTYYAGQSINIKRKLFYEFLSVDSKEELKKRGIVVKTVKKMKSRAQILKVKNQKQAETEHQKRLMNIENNLGLKSVRSMKDIYVNVKNSPISQIKASGQMHMTPLSGVFLKPEDEKGKLSTKSESAKEIKPAQIDLKNTKLTWQALNKMNLNQINDEDSLSEAIFSQKQQQKFKSSKSSQKSIFEYNMNDMNSALKSHDIRLEKGLKIVEKTKSSQFHN